MPGVKGMKWGVRRYQNEDGSLTPQGVKRYKNTKTTLDGSSKILSKANELGTGQKSKTVKKDYSNMTDDELKRRVNRLNMEEQYGRLTGQTKKVRSGSDWVHEILQDAAIITGMAGSAVGIYLALKSGKNK